MFLICIGLDWIGVSMGMLDTFCFDCGVLLYLDPGFGSYIFQMLIAGLVGAGFAAKLFWAQIKSFFVSLFAKINNNG
jgi:hypothetical protein